MQRWSSGLCKQVTVFLLSLTFASSLFGAVDACPPAARFQPVRIGVAYDASQSVALKSGKDKNSRYNKALESVGAKVVLLRNDEDPAKIDIRLSEIDGLLLPGGDDVAPARYGEEPHEKLGPVDEAFDAFEFRLLQAARERQLPVLGICRGHQVMNVFLGGSLYQDIPSQLTSSSPVMHRNRVNGKNTFCEHPLIVATGSVFCAIVGSTPLTVNTFHHQGIKALGKDLRIGATTVDGIIEAVEGTGEWFLLGVQFHPERSAASEPRMKAILMRFFAAARDHQMGSTEERKP